jgi:hypothetical protein
VAQFAQPIPFSPLGGDHSRGDFNMGQHKADIAAAFEKIG